MKKILSIDDEPTMLKCFEIALNGHGYELTTTSEPDDGIRIFRDNPDIELVMLDVRMPKKSGFDIYREMRVIRKVPVLFVTAFPRSFNSESDEIMKLWRDEFADGTTDIIYKPFELEQLYEKVEGLIGLPD
jgi:DNA-binding response OmpR family regulator